MFTVQGPVDVRWAIKKDLPAILAMDTEVDAMAREELERALKRREVVAVIAELEGEPAGYMVYELFENHIEVLRLVVAESRRRRGVGKALTDKLKYKAESHRRDCCSITVRDSATDTQLFLRSQGFRAVRVIRRCFEDPEADGYEFEFSSNWS